MDDERLLRSAVIYGANASGKSNLIKGVQEILSFVCDFKVAAGASINAYYPFWFDVVTSTPMFNNGQPVAEHASLPFSEESNRVKTLYTFGGKILSTPDQGGIIFVDELETNLHPYLSKLLVLLFQDDRINKKNAQLIFTTHDTNLLERNIFRRDQIWFAQKDNMGVTDLYSLQDFPDVREDTPFDKWYPAVKFGGIPDIKSLESLFEDL